MWDRTLVASPFVSSCRPAEFIRGLGTQTLQTRHHRRGGERGRKRPTSPRSMWQVTFLHWFLTVTQHFPTASDRQPAKPPAYCHITAAIRQELGCRSLRYHLTWAAYGRRSLLHSVESSFPGTPERGVLNSTLKWPDRIHLTRLLYGIDAGSWGFYSKSAVNQHLTPI